MRSTACKTRSWVGLVTALLALGALGCASGSGSVACSPSNRFRSAACHNRHAIEQLTFGMTRSQATAAMGQFEFEMPWTDEYGIAPDRIENPFDTRTYDTAIGEEYEVLRYVVDEFDRSDCPHVYKGLNLEPLIFFEGQLVGWRWSYLEDALNRAAEPDDLAWRVSYFCDGRPPTSGGGASPDQDEDQVEGEGQDSEDAGEAE